MKESNVNFLFNKSEIFIIHYDHETGEFNGVHDRVVNQQLDKNICTFKKYIIVPYTVIRIFHENSVSWKPCT
jgi:hypothetical protein